MGSCSTKVCEVKAEKKKCPGRDESEANDSQTTTPKKRWHEDKCKQSCDLP